MAKRRTRKAKKSDNEIWTDDCAKVYQKVMDAVDAIGEKYGGMSVVLILSKCVADAVENSSCKGHRPQVAANALQIVMDEIKQLQKKDVSAQKVDAFIGNRTLH
jgi:hypothetical protein